MKHYPETKPHESYSHDSVIINMCKKIQTQYTCGRLVRQYWNCKTNQTQFSHTSDMCRGKNVTLESKTAEEVCDGCQIVKTYEQGWNCCKCQQGPNRTALCCQRLTEGTRKICGHTYCKECKPQAETSDIDPAKWRLLEDIINIKRGFSVWDNTPGLYDTQHSQTRKRKTDKWSRKLILSKRDINLHWRINLHQRINLHHGRVFRDMKVANQHLKVNSN